MELSKCISIIVPIYNIQDYIDRCVDSLIKQDHKNIEILLIDDGSTDSSPAICDEWASKDSRIKAFHKPNGGLSDARNFGIDRASGEYILFVDGDDYIEENACTVLLDEAMYKNNDITVGNMRFISPPPKEIGMNRFPR